MEKDTNNVFFVGRANPVFGREIVQKCGYSTSDIIYTNFSDGEFLVQLGESVRGKNVFIIQSTNATEKSAADNLFELAQAADAAKRASAEKVIAVIPYFGFARQERKSKPRTPITAKLVAKILEVSGIDRVITMDLHAEAIQGFFEIPVDNLYASYVFVPVLREMINKNTLFASADSGGLGRATKYALYFGIDVISCYKTRKDEPNTIGSMQVIGDPSGKDVYIIEDIVDTAATLTNACEVLIKMGAKSVTILSSFGVLSGKAYENIRSSKVNICYVTDAHPNAARFLNAYPNAKIQIINSSEIFSKAITKVIEHGSVNDLFLF